MASVNVSAKECAIVPLETDFEKIILNIITIDLKKIWAIKRQLCGVFLSVSKAAATIYM